MSDIDIDLTGLLYMATVAFTAVAMFAIALVAVLLAVVKTDGRRAKRVAVAALGMAAVPCLLLAATFETVDTYAKRPDWIDYASIPWFALFVYGCWRLTRI